MILAVYINFLNQLLFIAATGFSSKSLWTITCIKMRIGVVKYFRPPVFLGFY